MALTSTTTSVITKPVNTVFMQTFLRQAKSRCIHFAGSKAAVVNTQMGSTVATWRRLAMSARGTSSAITEQTNAAYMNGRAASVLTFSPATATAAKYGNFVAMSEELNLINYSGNEDEIVQVMGIDAGDLMDSLQSGFMADNGNTIFAAGAASAGAVLSKITLNSVKNAVVTLDKNKALTFTPMTTGSQNFGTTQLMPGYMGACHPDVAPDIAALAGFKPAETYAGQVSLALGEFGAITVAGRTVRFCSGHNGVVDADIGGLTGSSGLISTTGTNIDLYYVHIYGREAWGSLGLGRMLPDGSFMAGDSLPSIELIQHGLGSGGSSDPLNEIATIGYKFWWAAAELNANWNRTIVCGASALTS